MVHMSTYKDAQSTCIIITENNGVYSIFSTCIIVTAT